MKDHVTLMQPDEGASSSLALSSGLPADLLAQAADRLRVLALLYAFVFFMAGIFPALLLPVERARFFESFADVGARRDRDRHGACSSRR